MSSALSLTVAMLNLSIYCQAESPPGTKGLPGDDWNEGKGGDRGVAGLQDFTRPQLIRPYLKQKKGRSNAPRTKIQRKSNSGKV